MRDWRPAGVDLTPDLLLLYNKIGPLVKAFLPDLPRIGPPQAFFIRNSLETRQIQKVFMSAPPENPETHASFSPASALPDYAAPPDLRREGRGMALCCAAFLLFYQITLHIHNDSELVVALSTLASLCLTLLCVVFAARAMRDRNVLAAAGGGAAVLIAPALLAAQIGPRFPNWTGWRTLGPALEIYFRSLNAVPGLRGLLLITLAAAVGVLLSRLVKEIKILLPIGVMLALVDLYVVFGGGLVTQAQQGDKAAQTAMQSLTVALPTVQRAAPNALPMELRVGFADYLFIALFFACFAKFGIPARRTFVVLSGVLALYMLVVLATGTALPALVPIAAVIILMNLRRFRYDRAEAFALFYAGLIIVGVFGFMAWRR